MLPLTTTNRILADSETHVTCDIRSTLEHECQSVGVSNYWIIFISIINGIFNIVFISFI